MTLFIQTRYLLEVLTIMKLIVLWVFNILVTVLAKHDSEVDLQTDYLKKQMGIAKSHPKVNGEINFSPDEKVFSNIVRSITGTKGW